MEHGGVETDTEYIEYYNTRHIRDGIYEYFEGYSIHTEYMAGYFLRDVQTTTMTATTTTTKPTTTYEYSHIQLGHTQTSSVPGNWHKATKHVASRLYSLASTCNLASTWPPETEHYGGTTTYYSRSTGFLVHATDGTL